MSEATTEFSLYNYNGKNQLTSSIENGLNLQYIYDATGLRQSKTVNGVTTSHIWDGTNMIAETNGDGHITNKYYRGLGLIYGEFDGNKNYYISNAHGDVCLLLDGNSNITKQYEYDAFGVELNKDNSDINPFRYCGEYQDLSSGLIYLRNRYYDPSIGRFISEDPIKADGNFYVYAKNNPIRFIDPWGLAAGDIFDTFDKMLADASKTTGKTETETSISWSSMTNANGAREYFWSGSSSGNQQVQNVISVINAYNGGFVNSEQFATNLRANGVAVPSTSTVTAGALRVPIYNQMNTPPTDTTNNLCWATSAAMLASFILGDTTDRTLAIAQTITGQTTVAGYNQPWWWASTDTLGLGITNVQTQTSGTLTMAEIQATITGGSPFGVLYNDGVSGHWIVGTGFINVQGAGQFVISNDPWGGVQSIQTHNKFLTLPDGRPWIETAR